jgi:hypothetical protein
MSPIQIKPSFTNSDLHSSVSRKRETCPQTCKSGLCANSNDFLNFRSSFYYLIFNKILRERTSVLRCVEREYPKAICLSLLKGGTFCSRSFVLNDLIYNSFPFSEGSLIRNIIRVIEDALLLFSGGWEGANDCASEVMSAYAEPTQWAGGGRGELWWYFAFKNHFSPPEISWHFRLVSFRALWAIVYPSTERIFGGRANPTKTTTRLGFLSQLDWDVVDSIPSSTGTNQRE